MPGDDEQIFGPDPEDDSASGDNATATVSEPKEKLRPSDRKPGYLPPYKVMLHNDDVNTFEHVITTIIKLTSLTPEDAIQRTIEAHESGVALLLVTHKERAELYQEQFMSASLTVTVEPDSA
jgi:ATP-dependent Clp protease adaptor protein ClpS